MLYNSPRAGRNTQSGASSPELLLSKSSSMPCGSSSMPCIEELWIEGVRIRRI